MPFRLFISFSFDRKSLHFLSTFDTAVGCSLASFDAVEHGSVVARGPHDDPNVLALAGITSTRMS